MAAAVATDQPQPQQAITDWAPGPVPTSYSIIPDVPTSDGRSMIALQMQTPVGISVYFIEAGAAVQFGNELRAAGKAGVSRLAVPPGANGHGLIVPGG
jgi:hypothetical protein